MAKGEGGGEELLEIAKYSHQGEKHFRTRGVEIWLQQQEQEAAIVKS